jgi:FeS assembly SUF system protein
MKAFWTRGSATKGNDDVHDSAKLSDDARDTAKSLDMPEPEPMADDASVSVDPAQLRTNVIAALRTIFDPEVPVNIYDLGLIYELDLDANGKVDIRMTLTTPGCPVAASFPQTVEQRLYEVPGVNEVRVELVWDPPWTMDRLSEDTKLQLGLL